MAWREALLTTVGPGALSGITLGDWLRVLRENRFSIDGPYWGRAAAITLGSVSNSVLRWWENLRFGRRIRAAKGEPPLFILGMWRSGTTHLHNLLAQDDRFAYPTFYQAVYPHTFLCTEAAGAGLLGVLLPKTRPLDNVRQGMGEPQEDEFALCCLTGRSFILSLAFPRRAEHFDRYLTFRGAAPSEVAEWKAALKWFVQKLSFKYGRPLLLKSPGHTCRIKMLLELFPRAKFVHIHRDPYAVFQSARHAVRKAWPWWCLQRPDAGTLDERTVCQYKEVFEVFFEERGLIPRGRLHEVRFEELEKDPIGQLRTLYESLDLPDFERVEPVVRKYLLSLSAYQKNVFPELSAAWRERLAREWRRCFEEWGYPTQGTGRTTVAAVTSSPESHPRSGV
jgi:hypothetical protein